ncbi:hypothetical protein KOXY103107_10075 [Komagataeibacter xylinus]
MMACAPLPASSRGPGGRSGASSMQARTCPSADTVPGVSINTRPRRAMVQCRAVAPSAAPAACRAGAMTSPPVTPTTVQPAPAASPCANASEARSPVNDPGPTTTPARSGMAWPQPHCANSSVASSGNCSAAPRPVAIRVARSAGRPATSALRQAIRAGACAPVAAPSMTRMRMGSDNHAGIIKAQARRARRGRRPVGIA